MPVIAGLFIPETVYDDSCEGKTANDLIPVIIDSLSRYWSILIDSKEQPQYI